VRPHADVVARPVTLHRELRELRGRDDDAFDPDWREGLDPGEGGQAQVSAVHEAITRPRRARGRVATRRSAATLTPDAASQMAVRP
jgi:hypothetical protein